VPTHSDEASSRLHVGRDLSGQAVVGNDNTAVWQQQWQPEATSAADVDQLRRSVAELFDLVDSQGSFHGRAVKEKLAELEEAVTAEQPNLATLEYVQGWFRRHLPQVSGAVRRLIVSPIVAKFIGAAGDDLVTEFHRRFSG